MTLTWLYHKLLLVFNEEFNPKSSFLQAQLKFLPFPIYLIAKKLIFCVWQA